MFMSVWSVYMRVYYVWSVYMRVYAFTERVHACLCVYGACRCVFMPVRSVYMRVYACTERVHACLCLYGACTCVFMCVWSVYMCVYACTECVHACLCVYGACTCVYGACPLLAPLPLPVCCALTPCVLVAAAVFTIRICTVYYE